MKAATTETRPLGSGRPLVRSDLSNVNRSLILDIPNLAHQRQHRIYDQKYR
jgi:hypothetical protein